MQSGHNMSVLASILLQVLKMLDEKYFLEPLEIVEKIRKKIISFLDFLNSENQLQLNIVAINQAMCTHSINTPDRPPLPFIHNSSELNMNVCITLWRKGSICK